MSTVEKLFCTVQGTNTLVLVGFAKKNKQTAVPYLPVVSPFECFMTVGHCVPFAFPHRDKPHILLDQWTVYGRPFLVKKTFSRVFSLKRLPITRGMQPKNKIPGILLHNLSRAVYDGWLRNGMAH
jgi:hypothetical protein